jgi:hypothetical protein
VGVRLVRGYVDQARRRLAEGVVLRRAATGQGKLLAYQEPVLRGSGSEGSMYVFRPPGSGSISQRYGSGFFYHQAKIVRKTLIPCVTFVTFV